MKYGQGNGWFMGERAGCYHATIFLFSCSGTIQGVFLAFFIVDRIGLHGSAEIFTCLICFVVGLALGVAEAALVFFVLDIVRKYRPGRR